MWGKILIVWLLVGGSWGLTAAQSPGEEPGVQSRLYEIYASGDIEQWPSVIEALKRRQKQSDKAEVQYELTFALYGYIGYALENGHKSEVKKYLDEAIAAAEALGETSAYQAAGYAFLGTFYAFEMQLATYKIPFLGPKSMAALKTAEKADSTNVHFLVEQGNQLFYSPSIFGGDKQLAITYYQKALDQMEHSAYFRKSWFRVNTFKQLEKGYRSTQQVKSADETYGLMVQLFPECKWEGAQAKK